MAVPHPSHFHFIIGSAKSGTTSLFTALKEHEEVHVGLSKEPHFFSKIDRYLRGTDEYLNNFQGFVSDSHKIALDASATYSQWPQYRSTPERIAAFNQDAKLIYIVRNPFERIRSHNQMGMVLHGRPSINTDSSFEAFYTIISNYNLQIKQYLSCFSRSSFAIIDFDELVEAPRLTLQKVCSHFGIQYRDNTIVRRVHDSSILYSAYFIKRVLIADKRISERATTSAALACFNSLTVEEQNFVKRLSASIYTPSEEVVSRIKRSLYNDMIEFSETYGIDVNKWGF